MADLLVTQLRQLLQIDTSRINSRIFPKNYEDVIQVIFKTISLKSSFASDPTFSFFSPDFATS